MRMRVARRACWLYGDGHGSGELTQKYSTSAFESPFHQFRFCSFQTTHIPNVETHKEKSFLWHLVTKDSQPVFPWSLQQGCFTPIKIRSSSKNESPSTCRIRGSKPPTYPEFTAMLSVASLLNPVNSEQRNTRLPSSPSSSLCTSSSTYGSPQFSNQSSFKKQKMTKDGAVFAKGKIKGEVNFPSFENLDDGTLREVQRFQVYPLGKIQEYCRHIPYNSEKKSFLEKTGRESFEGTMTFTGQAARPLLISALVFQYIFKVPGDDKEYTVMWDYNIGLVRITPFFKCCKYSKVSLRSFEVANKSRLKEITHSITGGAWQLKVCYWMPYSCALAVCTTFCAHIAGALIPIFGPTFPSQCVPPEAAEYGRWIIDPSIVIKATAEAESYRSQHSSFSPKSSRDSYSPKQPIHNSLHIRTTPPQHDLGRRLRLKRAFGGDSPYGTQTDTDLDTNASEASSTEGGYFCSPVTPASANSFNTPRQNHWHARNMISHSANSSINIASHKILPGSNPLLSSIPRSSGILDTEMSGTWNPKRRVEEVDADDEYDGEESTTATDDKGSDHGKGLDGSSCGNTISGAEKKAAWLLMKLSVKDSECSTEAGPEPEREAFNVEGPRIKRRKATSIPQVVMAPAQHANFSASLAELSHSQDPS
ncbi:hypothetical protein G7Y89_g9208 [Cudoniella acicularis]|uniref:HTH APSES-type domain-containing protein n=1 Tax=Cudoniella acicularis TaxID=354080 RepID=A0A8H4RG20_9HELO|nr:hypothetical protein G7Y89_g9208 [Cudoniella acicularis]